MQRNERRRQEGDQINSGDSVKRIKGKRLRGIRLTSRAGLPWFNLLLGFAIAVSINFGLSQPLAMGQQANDNDRLERAVEEIASARINEAVKQHWNDKEGFSLSPTKLEDAVSADDTEHIKKLLENYPTIWKSTGPAFAKRYRDLQGPVNEKRLQNAPVLRKLIADGIAKAVSARGGGSTSGMLRVFAEAETEWILHEVCSARIPTISDAQFTDKLRSEVFYTGEQEEPEARASFNDALAKFRQAEALMNPIQRAAFRREILAYFGD